MALSNAERQRRYRQRRRAGETKVVYRKPKGPRSRNARLKDAIETIITIREEYRDWRDSVPEALEDTATVALLEQVLEALDALELDSLAAAGPVHAPAASNRSGSTPSLPHVTRSEL